MDTHTLITLSVLMDHFQKEEALIRDTLEQLRQIPGVTEDPDIEQIGKPDNPIHIARTKPVTATDQEAEPEKDFTFEQVREIFTDRSGHGLKAEMRSILTAHGLKKLSDAKEDQHLLNRLAAEAEAIRYA